MIQYFDNIIVSKKEVNFDINCNDVCIETKDKFILITFDKTKEVNEFIRELKEAIKKR